MSTPHYHINLFWPVVDGCWIADVPDFRYCSIHGDTPDEAIANVQDAVAGWIKVAREQGLEVPRPRYRPAIYAVA